MIVQLILAWLQFLIGPLGFFTFGLGLITFLGLPVLSKATGIKTFANVHLWLAMWAVQRACLVLSEHGDLLFKSMTYVDLGVERVQMANDAKDFEDPAAALSHWMGYPFALGSERDGVLFDPRHAAIAAKKRAYGKRNMGSIVASEEDYQEHGVDEWMPGVFEIPKANELVDLTAIHHIIDGGERAEYPQRIEKLYKLSRDPFTSGKQALRLLLPVAAFVGVLVVLWQISSNMGGSGGGQTVGYGAMGLLAARNIDWKRLLGAIVAVVVPVGILLGLVLLTNPLYAMIVVGTYGLGLMVVPGLAFLTRMHTPMAEKFARQGTLKLGLLGYDVPIMNWTPSGYELVEYADLDETADVSWFSLVGTQIGFTFPAEEDSFGPDVVPHDELEGSSSTSMELATDGSGDLLPTGYVRAPNLLAGIYGGYVPADVDDDTIYLNSGIALNRMADAANGEKSMKRLLQSKEKYGGGTFGVSDKLLMYSTLAATFGGAILGVFLFFL